MSVLWIAGLSFVCVVCVEKTGCIIGIDEYTMGLVVIAIGTSIPVGFVLFHFLRFFYILFVSFLVLLGCLRSAGRKLMHGMHVPQLDLQCVQCYATMAATGAVFA